MRINSQIGTLSLRHQTTPLSDGIDSGKESAIESMIEDGYTPSLKGPDPTQREQLHSGLSKVDRGVLLWARRQGVKIQVLQKGEVLEQADVLRDLTGKFEQRIDSAFSKTDITQTRNQTLQIARRRKGRVEEAPSQR